MSVYKNFPQSLEDSQQLSLHNLATVTAREVGKALTSQSNLCMERLQWRQRLKIRVTIQQDLPHAPKTTMNTTRSDKSRGNTEGTSGLPVYHFLCFIDHIGPLQIQANK